MNIKTNKTKNLLIGAILLFVASMSAQTVSAKFGKGIHFVAKDSSMDMKLTFRFQTLFLAEQTFDIHTKPDDDFISEMMIRRSRIKMDGFIYNPKLTYKVELALSNRDIGLGSSTTDGSKFNNASNIVLDAVLKWEFAKNTELWFGQTKLPSNRERVISSQKLQFVDRSLLNNQFNLDRDIGAHLRHKTQIGSKFLLKEIAVISMGEGRNVTSANDDAFCYTGRIEALPFGEFTKEGDYSGSDLERETTPKLSLAATYDYNDDAKRSRGQLGSFLKHDSLIRDIQSVHADMMFKYKGISVMGEYAKRFIAEGDKNNSYYVGTGYNLQAGYLFKNNVELAGRFSQLRPEKWNTKENKFLATDKTAQFTLGLSKYFVKHNLKIQTDLSSEHIDNNPNILFMYRFQVEMQF